MSILAKYNKKPVFNYDSTKKRDYTNLRELFDTFGEDKNYVVHALFINKKSRFGDAPIIVTDRFMVNAPHHLLDTVQEMLGDQELIDMVNERKVGFKIYEYHGRNGTGYSVEWIEL